jgi:hypothetical protein
LAWQLYAPGTDSLSINVRMEPLHVSALRRAAARLRLVRDPDVINVRWPVSGVDSTLHTLAVHLPANAHGFYRITVSLQGPGRTLASSSRELELIPPPSPPSRER